MPGISTNEIVGAFGEPFWREELEHDHQVWHYSVPSFLADDEMRGSLVVGFSVGLTNGQLANWGCSYSEVLSDQKSPKYSLLPIGGEVPAISPQLQFFIVSSSPVAGGQFIDTERLPKLGFIAPTPTLIVTKVKEVTVEEGTLDSTSPSHRVWSFGIFLTPDDGVRLKSMTSTNVSSRVLIMVGDEPISAPKIVAPLDSGSLTIKFDDPRLMELLKTQLLELRH